MKLALIGFGNMGQEVKKIVDKTVEDEIISISLRSRKDKLDIKGIQKADVAIDFSSPDTVFENIKTVAGLGVSMVIGTTGWYEQIKKVQAIVLSRSIGFVYGQNFSVGANIFFKIIANAAALCSNFDYDVFGYEVHHSGKKDSPSGTAKKIGQIVLENFPTKQVLQSETMNRKIQNNEFHFASVRGGRNPGFHEVVFDSFADEIKISHLAHSRAGFALGALLAARFIQNKKGFYSFDQVFAKGVKNI